MTLVEKVVNAMELASNKWVTDTTPIANAKLEHDTTVARAAISVVLEAMREPTPEMLRASTMLVPTWDDDASRRKWQAMLAAFTRTALDADTGV